jgi:predicted dehydrogenase
VEQYRSLESIACVAVADVNADAARAAADALGLEACASVDELLGRDDIYLVHIATPPTTHAELVTRVLEAGKHVLCEKPLATELKDAKAMIALAEKKRCTLSVNLIMRYNPLAEAVRSIVRTKLLGEPLHGFFENYAKDEPLGPDHWFWKRELSGGIFIEHGVHFFDLFQWWLGSRDDAGKVEAAQQVQRPGAAGELIEQVQATVRYKESVLVNFYHGFTQAERMDRQEMRIVFERGTLRLFEWVPTRLEIDALCDGSTVEALQHVLPEPQCRRVAEYHGPDKKVYSRHKHYEVDGRYEITSGVGMDKPALYGHVLRGLLDDQIQAIHDPDHKRRITEANGYTSLAIATEADRLARGG